MTSEKVEAMAAEKETAASREGGEMTEGPAEEGSQPPRASKELAPLREAEEVYLLMHKNCRVSRNIRAQWLLEHLDRPVQLYTTIDDPLTDVLVYGIIPKGGSPSDSVGDEKFVVTAETRLSFISRFYRQVYVLDLSPSTLVADEVAGCCLFTLLLDHLRACLISITQQVIAPGSGMPFNPQIYLTVLVFTPYLGFNEQSVLLQGVLLTCQNVHEVYDEVATRFHTFLTSLHLYSQPIIAAWGKKNLHKRRKYDSTSSAEMVKMVKPSHTKRRRREKRSLLEQLQEVQQPVDVFSYRRHQWLDEESYLCVEEEEDSTAPCDGYIKPENSLIFMIRMGMLAIQLLPENTQSNIVLVTDAVCGMPEAAALHDLLVQLRELSVACSFIQVQGRVRSEPSFGHIASCELFHFLAIATFGAYMPNCRCILSELNCEDGRINSYQRQLLCWWFQKALHENIHIKNIVRDINYMFAELYTTDMRRHREAKITYECAVRDVIYIRMREGYTMKHIRQLEGGSTVQVVLLLPFRPLVTIEYSITAAAPLKHYRRQLLTVDVELVAPYNVLRELIGDPTTINANRRKAIRAYRETIDGILEADRILTHIHSFYTQEIFYSIPSGLSHCAIGLFNERDLPPPMLKTEEDLSCEVRFDRFWRRLLVVEERIWHKFTHTHELRMLLEPSDGRHMRPFLNPQAVIDFRKAANSVHGFLASMSSFCLLHRQIYVKFVTDQLRSNGAPRFFYVIRVTGTAPLITLRVSFIGGMTTSRRIAAMHEMRDGLSELRLDRRREKAALALIRRPLERLLLKYHSLPLDVHSLLSLPPHLVPNTTSITAYQALYKYLPCKRVIWKLPRLRETQRISPKLATFLMELLFKKRLLRKFGLAWMSNGVVGMCRQVEYEGERKDRAVGLSEETKFALQQVILFPPVVDRAEVSRICGAFDSKFHDQSAADVVLVEEMWSEPIGGATEEDDPLANEAILTTLFTLDKLFRLCDPHSHRRRSVKTSIGGGEETGRTHTRCIQFSIGELISNAYRHLLLIPFHLHEDKGKEENDTQRAEITLAILHRKLHNKVDTILQVADPDAWSKMAGSLEKKTAGHLPSSHGCEFSLYLVQPSKWSLAGVAVPSSSSKLREWKRGAIPLLFFYLDRPSILHSFLHGIHLRSIIDDRREDSNPPSYAPPEKVPADACISTQEDPFDLCAFVSDVYEGVIVRVLVSSLFRAVNQELAVHARAVLDVTDEYCDHMNLEVDGVDNALRTFCTHLQNAITHGEYYDSSDARNSCTGEGELELSFSSILSKFFKAIPSSPSYYYFRTNSVPEGVEEENVEEEDNEEKAEEVEEEEKDEGRGSSEDENGKEERGEKQRKQRRKAAEVPLFLYFLCGLRFPNGDMETFPIHTLPSCIHQLIRKASYRPSQPFRLTEVKVSLDLYVLTWPMEEEEEYMQQEEVTFAQAKRNRMLKLLPAPERAVVNRLLRSIGYMIEQEMVLMESRRETPLSYEKLQAISAFISREASDSNKAAQVGRIEEKVRQLALVIPSPEALERLKTRMDGMKVEYCSFRRVDDYFYCCQVSDHPQFASIIQEKRKASANARGDSFVRVVNDSKHLSTIDERDEDDFSMGLLRPKLIYENCIDISGKDIVCDFWVIIRTTDQFHIQFCQRYSHFRHYTVYEEAWRAVKRMLRTVNQQLLLEKTYETGLCNSLLLATRADRGKYTSESEQSVDGEDESSSRDQIADSARFLYTPGTFACPMVAHHWFDIPPRLPVRRPLNSGRAAEQACAHDTLRSALAQFIVRNLSNVYIVREVTGSVFYMYLHSSMESLARTVNRTEQSIPRSILSLGDDYFKTHILLGIHGVDTPGDEILTELPEGLQKKLDHFLLDQLVATFAKNPKSALTIPDVQFIQRTPQSPAFRLTLSLPERVQPLLSAFCHYLHQHIPLVWSPVKYKTSREERSFGQSFDESQSAPKTGGFISYRGEGQQWMQTYSPSFYVIVRRPEHGKRTFGFACAEVRVCTGGGDVAWPLREGRLTKATRSLLLGDAEFSRELFDLLTSTEIVNLEEVDDAWKGRIFVECIVWQVGDVGEQEVGVQLRSLVRESLADIVTEFALLNTNLDEIAPPTSPQPKPSHAPSRWVLGRDSSSEAPPLSPHPLLAPPPHVHSKQDGVAFSFDTKRGVREGEAVANRQLVTSSLFSLIQWFDFVFSLQEGEGDKAPPHSLQKATFVLKTAAAALDVADVLGETLEADLRGGLPDRVSVYERTPDGRFPLAKPPVSKSIQEDLGVDVPLGSRFPSSTDVSSLPDVVIVSRVPDVWVETKRFGFEPVGDAPDSLRLICEDGKKELFIPRLCPFVPRLRLLLLTVTGNTISLYLYNFDSSLVAELTATTSTATQWQDAKIRLLREIGLHKMGFCHFAPPTEDSSSSSNSYLPVTLRLAESLSQCNFPPHDVHPEKLPRDCAAQMAKVFRRMEPSFLTSNLHECLLDDQLHQLVEVKAFIRNELLLHHCISQTHSRLLYGEPRLQQVELCDLLSASRPVHLVQSPLLFFPKWRRKIASIRLPERRRRRETNAKGYDSGSKATPPGRHRALTLSTSVSSSSSAAHSPSLRLHADHSDPYQLRLETVLMEEYSEYLCSLGLRTLEILEERNRQTTLSSSRQASRGEHPQQWLCSAIDSGLLLIHLSFSPPYFLVQFHMWSAASPSVADAIEEEREKTRLRSLERAKNDLVGASHVHSFTYDFHLRMLSKYLLSKDQMLFQHGYNTSAFLVDFLQYYGCRPPYARNCIYEECASFALQHSISANQIWDHFLNFDDQYKWKVVKMKQSDADGNQSADFMLVSSEPDAASQHDIVRVCVHSRLPSAAPAENRLQMANSGIEILIYVIIVANNHKAPLMEERRREDSKASDGEFRHVAPPPLPDGDSPLRGKGAGLADEESEIERMISLVNEGVLPTVEGREGREGRRRCSSGGHLTPVPTLSHGKPSSIGDGGDSASSLSSVLNSWQKTEVAEGEGSMVAIQQIAPRRHRKNEQNELHGSSGGIARERAIYIHFLSGRQTRLQKVVEDATAQYRRQLQKCVSDGEWLCRRDSLWEATLCMPADRRQPAPHSFFKQNTNYADPWSYLRAAASESHTASLLDTLLSVVRVVHLHEREPRLSSLLRCVSSAALARHLLSHYGIDRCRFFEYPHSTKKCLVITNPNYLRSAFLLKANRETTPLLCLLLKEEWDGEEEVQRPVDGRARLRHRAIQDAFDEIINCILAFSWTNLCSQTSIR